MPLAFRSISHGVLPFGFYNIETDSLLCGGIFFFCSDFCAALEELEREGAGRTRSVEIDGHLFGPGDEIGDLMGAISGVDHSGYLGEVYSQWPFPADPSGFRQKIGGEGNRQKVEEILGHWGRPAKITLLVDDEGFSIGPVRFDRDAYLALVSYVWRGGYPTWEGFEEGRRPACVSRLAEFFPHLVSEGAAG